MSWYPAYDGNTPILGYLLQYKPRVSTATAWQHHNNNKKNLTIPASASSATMIGLEPDTEYQVTVLSRNSVGVGQPSQQVVATTAQEAPSGPPQSVRVEPVSSTELRVTWN